MVHTDVDRIEKSQIEFIDGKNDSYEAIVCGTGYENGLSKMIDLKPERLDDLNRPVSKRFYLGKNGLYFCGYYVSPAGMLREIRIESGFIADHIASLR